MDPVPSSRPACIEPEGSHLIPLTAVRTSHRAPRLMEDSSNRATTIYHSVNPRVLTHLRKYLLPVPQSCRYSVGRHWPTASPVGGLVWQISPTGSPNRTGDDTFNA
ncbi:hypothetical protein IG631_06391 [Alternaria alternata]|nr:hypothetical protein IG631_06391 [Alternaria alternata]